MRTADPSFLCFLWFLSPTPAHLLTHTHSPSRMSSQERHRGFQYVQCGWVAGRVPCGGRRGRLQAAAAHHTRLAGLRRGCKGTRRQSWAGPRPQRETGSSWKLGDGTEGARAASTNSLFPPEPSRRVQGDARLRVGLEKFSGWPCGVTLVTVGGDRRCSSRQCARQILTLGGQITSISWHPDTDARGHGLRRAHVLSGGAGRRGARAWPALQAETGAPLNRVFSNSSSPFLCSPHNTLTHRLILATS